MSNVIPWKSWNKHLSKFKDKKIKVLEIGIYTGRSAEIFFKYILTHPKSEYYGIDTFKGSSEYSSDIDFKEIEKKFKKRIKPYKDRVNVIKAKSEIGLVKLLSKKSPPKFDIIFIDGSHEARDVLSDAVLSWKLLKTNGIMIFDDYQWNKLSPSYFTPRPAIDSFVFSYKPEIKILENRSWQFFIQKIKQTEKPQKIKN